ncbi:site-specific integrase [Methylobacterium planeticum]|uniref:hypothetical protein n=1 Tax=Methylobacterium planeticum TaxID=2615211 RepID=UPI00177D016C|nr:hypothetical protein [Methylobacterium planeticum]
MTAGSFVTPTRTEATNDVYLREGCRHLRRATKHYPMLACQLTALVTHFETDPVKLRARTVRRYRCEVETLIDWLAARPSGPAISTADAKARIDAALERRRSKAIPNRTSRCKVRDPGSEEYDAVLADLMARARLAEADTIDRLLPVFVLAAPQVGLRPIEWAAAWIDGEALVVPCAKRTNGRGCADHRRIGLGGLDASVQSAISLILGLLPGLLEVAPWERLRKTLAERLARSCARARQRRLSLYSFRHLALASWKAAGLDPAGIAALAGHKTVAMQRSYAGARHGWCHQTGLAIPDPELAAAISGGIAGATEQSATRKATPEVQAQDPVVIDEAGPGTIEPPVASDDWVDRELQDALPKPEQTPKRRSEPAASPGLPAALLFPQFAQWSPSRAPQARRPAATRPDPRPPEPEGPPEPEEPPDPVRPPGP